ncbi:MAG: hypothetical protein M0014_15575 [Actinomycetota bacterium]|nr:hypothetical protein [Actinomycetota bacterium]
MSIVDEFIADQEDVERWAKRATSSGERLAWLDAGVVEPDYVVHWRDLGFGPDDARRWFAVTHRPTDVLLLEGLSVPPDEASTWLQLRITVGDVVLYRQAGWTIDEARWVLNWQPLARSSQRYSCAGIPILARANDVSIFGSLGDDWSWQTARTTRHKQIRGIADRLGLLDYVEEIAVTTERGKRPEQHSLTLRAVANLVAAGIEDPVAWLKAVPSGRPFDSSPGHSSFDAHLWPLAGIRRSDVPAWREWGRDLGVLDLYRYWLARLGERPAAAPRHRVGADLAAYCRRLEGLKPAPLPVDVPPAPVLAHGDLPLTR